MTNGSNENVADDPRRRWACQQLGMPSDVSLDQARRRWLERLSVDNFVPGEDAAQAFALLNAADQAGVLPDEPAALVLRRENESLDDVEAFAAGFFHTSPAEQRTHFIELRRKAARTHQAKAQLDGLEPALDVELPSPEALDDGESGVESLSAHIGRLFVMTPVRRAEAQRRLLGELSKNGDAWELVARRLQHDHADVARLMPELVSYLAAWRRHRTIESRRVIRRRRKRRASQKSLAAQREGLGWWWIAIVAIPIGIMLAYLNDNNRAHAPVNERKLDPAIEELEHLRESALESLNGKSPQQLLDAIPHNRVQFAEVRLRNNNVEHSDRKRAVELPAANGRTMNTDRLNDDVRDWPDDPFQLLGVSQQVNARDARRAYTRLIRKYKPEHFPEHFRRLREAYESVQSTLAWREWSALAPPDAEEDAASRNPPPNQPAAVQRYAGISVDPLEEAWELATGGQPKLAYERLEAQRRNGYGGRDLALREYWLLKVCPHIDAHREACEVLVEAVVDSALDGPAVELYRRELSSRPAEALTDRCEKLLDTPATAQAVANLLEWRWLAAGGLERWEVIIRDVDRFRSRISGENDEVWARLLLAAIDQLAWAHTSTAYRRTAEYRQELDRLHHVHLQLSYAMDRLDLLMEASEGWHQVRLDPLVPADVTRLLARSWQRPYWDIRAAAVDFLTFVASQPRQALDTLDRIQAVSPALVAQASQVVELYQQHEGRYDDSGRGDAGAATAARRFLMSADWTSYRAVRRRLLEFCLEQAIAPLRVVTLTEDAPELHELPFGDHLGDVVNRDGPLQCVYQAHRVFWQ